MKNLCETSTIIPRGRFSCDNFASRNTQMRYSLRIYVCVGSNKFLFIRKIFRINDRVDPKWEDNFQIAQFHTNCTLQITPLKAAFSSYVIQRLFSP